MSFNSFERKLTLLNVLLIHSVVFNISRGFCFYLAVNKDSERTALRTVAGFPSCVRACTRPRAVPCLSDGLWSSEGTYCTRPGLLEMLACTFFLLAEEQPGLMHLNGPAGAHLFRDGPPL